VAFVDDDEVEVELVQLGSAAIEDRPPAPQWLAAMGSSRSPS